MTLALERCHERWYDLIPHPVQLQLRDSVSTGLRFPLVPAGRRSGKTERFKRFLAKTAMTTGGEKFFAAAPTHTQAKKIFWNDLKLLTYAPSHSRRASESEQIIYLPNESEIHVFGLDKPERMEGVNWTGGGIDEIADVKAKAVNENIMPSLDTVDPRRADYRAWCWFLGVPDGLNHYYDMCERAELGIDPESKVFHWKSSEILPPEVIAAAKKRLSPRQFRQEYEASFETASGKIYEDYSKANHTDAVIEPHEQLCWMHDQNYTPLSSAIGVRRGPKGSNGNYLHTNDLYLLDEIILTSAISRQSALEFVDKYKDHKNKHVLVYGDPAGKAGEKHGHSSDYTEIEGVLKTNGWSYTRKVKAAHPAIRDRQNSVRAKILNANGDRSLYINPLTAEWCHKGLATVQTLDGSSYQEDQKNQYQHITTAIGYMIDYEFPIHEKIQRLKIGGV